MASGVPVVAVCAGGLLDLVDSSRTGWLYPPGDLQALRARVADLAGDQAKRHAMGTAALASVRARTWPVVCDRLVRHYDQAARSIVIGRS
jgi:phosphatidylinositol alpha 1,6-mannosyltransferase